MILLPTWSFFSNHFLTDRLQYMSGHDIMVIAHLRTQIKPNFQLWTYDHLGKPDRQGIEKVKRMGED